MSAGTDERPVTLTTEELGLLLEMLRDALGETRVEIHHTDSSPNFRDQLLKREGVTRDLIVKLERADALGSAGEPE